MPSQFRDLEGKIEVINNQARIVLSGPEKALGGDGITGDICVEDPVLGIKTKARISIVKQPKVRISPKVVKLEKVEGRENCYQANFLVKASSYSEKIDQAIATLPSTTIQEIDCQCDTGKTTSTETRFQTRCTASICRLRRKKIFQPKAFLNGKFGPRKGCFQAKLSHFFKRSRVMIKKKYAIFSAIWFFVPLFVVQVLTAQEGSGPEESAPCHKDSLDDCDPGTSTTCSQRSCETWYLNPETQQWQLSGNPKWTTELRCSNPGAIVYTNTTDIPVVIPAPPGVAGKRTPVSLGYELCATIFNCHCDFPNAQHGSPCQSNTNPIELKIHKAEISGDSCTGS
jgi:hypothetical protein